jgi:hypothetical protein
MYMFIYIIFWLNKKLILINKVVKYNWEYDPYCKIKYLKLHLFFDFFNLVFLLSLTIFLLYLLVQIILN